MNCPKCNLKINTNDKGFILEIPIMTESGMCDPRFRTLMFYRHCSNCNSSTRYNLHTPEGKMAIVMQVECVKMIRAYRELLTNRGVV